MLHVQRLAVRATRLLASRTFNGLVGHWVVVGVGHQPFLLVLLHTAVRPVVILLSHFQERQVLNQLPLIRIIAKPHTKRP